MYPVQRMRNQRLKNGGRNPMQTLKLVLSCIKKGHSRPLEEGFYRYVRGDPNKIKTFILYEITRKRNP